MTINELIEQIGGRERLEFIAEDCAEARFSEIEAMARALLAVLDVQAATHECNDSPFKKVEIVWLGKCRCGNKVHTASTIKGGCDRLYDDDEVTCNACGRRGVIQCCEGCAGVLWETELERTTPPAASAPDGWLLIPAIPSQSHLNSIAMRYSHDFYLLPDNQRESVLSTARQMYEECSGQGFYSIPKPAAPAPGGDGG